ncbi:lysosomal protective protein-like isoform X3 [Rhipicephalus microplus]|uniref:lysosomal protective protein-like isoform X3 n=1 Tax=Rhipicephalus microplus TaxID=6941 RepID=UPI003F6CB50C
MASLTIADASVSETRSCLPPLDSRPVSLTGGATYAVSRSAKPGQFFLRRKILLASTLEEQGRLFFAGRFMESQRSPSEDPVLLWLNGGPCCSSLVGAIAELGPFRVGYQGINMTTNPSSWNKVANIIFLESPAGVGFSYERSGNYASDDTQTTDQNYLATLNFFDEYPMFKKNDFYIAGESYAGVYVPLLAQRFVKDPRGINLKGYAVGNGALDMELLGKSIMFFGYYHGLFGQRLWKELTTNCCNGSISQETCDFGWSTKNPACIDPVKRANQIILSSGLNVYNLYDPCNYDQGSWSLAPRYSDSTMQHAFRRLVKKLFKWPTTPTSEYRMWHVDGVISGFVQNFEHNITFVTLKGSGHMVPLDKAAESLHMITNFLSGTPFL